MLATGASGPGYYIRHRSQADQVRETKIQSKVNRRWFLRSSPVPTHPRLTSETVTDNQQLATAIEALLHDDEEYGRLTQRILDAQERLREQGTFDCYLEIEALVNVRTGWALLAVARWAFEEGRKSS